MVTRTKCCDKQPKPSGPIKSHFLLATGLLTGAVKSFRKCAFSTHYTVCSCVLFLHSAAGTVALTGIHAFTSNRKPVDFLISHSCAGYRIRLGSSTDKKDTGRLHVDYAQARDDLYEWECRQRMLAREERHRRRIEEDRLRPPSPPPIVHYSEHECSQLGEKIKGAHFIITTETLSVFFYL